MKELNRDQQRKFTPEAPIDFLPRRRVKHVVRKDSSGALVASRPHYEPALLTTLNERLKSGEVTASHSQRWSDFEEYLIPRPRWNNERAQHYAALELPLDADGYLSQLNEQLKGVTATVDRRAPDNDVLKIDSEKGEFHLAAMKRKEKPDAVKKTKDLIQFSAEREPTLWAC